MKEPSPKIFELNESGLPLLKVPGDLGGTVLHNTHVEKASEWTGVGRYVTTCSACPNVIGRGSRKHCLYWAKRHRFDNSGNFSD
jgi:hypothetical protein